MPGGLIQLKAYGAQDFNLTGNPQISFFKTVYRRYTNFAMEYFTLFPEVNLPLSTNDIVKYNFEIKRNGDLINNIYFNFTIPDIYSDKDVDFKWIKNLGTSIIHKVSIFLGGSLIDENYGEWLNIWNELTLDSEKKNQYNEMIGNVPELYAPENAPGNLYYPNKNKVSDTIPSIKGRVISVPLDFWFNKNSSLSLPLIALQYTNVTINVEIRKIPDLYTVIDIETDSPSFAKRIKPNTTTNNINNFIKNINDVNSTNLNFFIDPFLQINYIYLAKEEMAQFAKSEHKYLINQVKLNNFTSILGSKTLELSLHNPVKYIIVVAKRTDVEDRNDWNNYTNWIDEKIPPYTSGFINPFFEKYSGDSNLLFEKVHEKFNNYQFKKSPFIIKNLQLKLDGNDRFSSQDSIFFNKIMPNNFSKNIPKDGIYFYSFSINPFDYQPSGSCNMSRFSNIELFVETLDVPISSTLNENLYKYDINVYTVNYNILRIFGGTGNIEFSN